MGTPFVRYLQSVHPRIEASLHDRMPRVIEERQSADLERYLYEPFARLVFAGGKRVRPALCLLGAEAVGGSSSSALPLACAIELFQAAALVHDDIADQSEMRRGVPCIHISEGTGIAINSGDVGIVDVVAQVLQEETYAPELRLKLFDELYAMERRTLEGQALDLGWVREGRWDLREEDYLCMATLKTAHYSAATPLVAGAMCGGATAEQVASLRSFGLAAGLAFQIQDDLLNLVGDAEAQGKDYRSDVAEGKRTLVMVRALSQLDAKDAHELQTILSTHTTEEAMLARAVELAEEADAIAYAQAYAQRLISEAKEHLASASITDEAQEVLVSMADFFVSRAN